MKYIQYIEKKLVSNPLELLSGKLRSGESIYGLFNNLKGFNKAVGRSNSETNFFVLGFPSMRCTIICGTIFGLVSSSHDFENKAAIDWNSVDFILSSDQLGLDVD